MDERKEKDEQNNSRPSLFTYLFVGLFSVLVGGIARRKFQQWCKEQGISERAGCGYVFIGIWLIGAVLLVLSWIGYVISLLF